MQITYKLQQSAAHLPLLHTEVVVVVVAAAVAVAPIDFFPSLAMAGVS